MAAEASQEIGLDDLPHELLAHVVAALDAKALCAAACVGRDSQLAMVARRDEAWRPHVIAVGIGAIGDQPLRSRYLSWRWAVFGARHQLQLCSEGKLPFLRALGHPRAIDTLPNLLSYGLVCDIVKLQGEHAYKYRDGAAWIARRTKDPASVDERRLAAALREVFQRCFPPAQDRSERRPARRRADCDASATATCAAHEALAERLPQAAIRTACDTFGRYSVAKAEDKWLRQNSTTF